MRKSWKLDVSLTRVNNSTFALFVVGQDTWLPFAIKPKASKRFRRLHVPWLRFWY